jgi:hypothetical protein
MTTRTASCSCGQLSLTFEGDPARVSLCHCRACQRRTGSAFGMQARFARAQLRAQTGRASEWVRTGDAGTRITFRFCPECGTTLYWELPPFPDALIVAAGAFADATLPAPTFSVYEARMHAWFTLPGAEIEHMD